MTDQLSFIIEIFPRLLFGFPGQGPGGLLLSILIAVMAITLGFGIALVLGSGHRSER